VCQAGKYNLYFLVGPRWCRRKHGNTDRPSKPPTSARLCLFRKPSIDILAVGVHAVNISLPGRHVVIGCGIIGLI
jgi:hypothetical protein